MILDEQENTKVETNIPHSEFKNFTIKESKKAFDILQSSLYRDSISSIIRELATNAYDSHIMASQTKPFTIHVPTSMEPYFSVEDYGQGISHEDVLRIYSTFFESTKTASNDTVGALGLGSKSPFSYTKNFTVTSIYNGLESTYSLFINDDGIPAIARLAVSPTEKSNGVLVRLPTKADDLYSWIDKAGMVLRGFPSECYTLNRSKVNFKYSAITLSGKDISSQFGVYEDDSYYSNSSLVKMGTILYPIDFSEIVEESGLSDLMKIAIKKVIETKLAFVIDAKIGEVDILPSREGLKNTKKTIEFIAGKMASFVKEVRSIVKQTILEFNPEYSKITALEFKEVRTIIGAQIKLDKMVIELMNGFISSDFRLTITPDLPVIHRSMTHREKYTHQHQTVEGSILLVKDGYLKPDACVISNITIVKRLTSVYNKGYLRGAVLRVLESDLTPEKRKSLEEALLPSGISLVEEDVVPRTKSVRGKVQPLKRYAFTESYKGKAYEINASFLTETVGEEYDCYCETNRFSVIGMEGFDDAEILRFVRENRVIFISMNDKAFDRQSMPSLNAAMISHYRKVRDEIDSRFEDVVAHIQQTERTLRGNQNPLKRLGLVETGIAQIDSMLKEIDLSDLPMESVKTNWFRNTYINQHLQPTNPLNVKFIEMVDRLVGNSSYYHSSSDDKKVIVKLMEVCYNQVFME